jgi:hypothetical protein
MDELAAGVGHGCSDGPRQAHSVSGLQRAGGAERMTTPGPSTKMGRVGPAKYTVTTEWDVESERWIAVVTWTSKGQVDDMAIVSNGDRIPAIVNAFAMLASNGH